MDYIKLPDGTYRHIYNSGVEYVIKMQSTVRWEVLVRSLAGDLHCFQANNIVDAMARADSAAEYRGDLVVQPF